MLITPFSGHLNYHQQLFRRFFGFAAKSCHVSLIFPDHEWVIPGSYMIVATMRQMMQLSCFDDLREESFKIALWSKGFFVQPAKTGTVTWEQLVAMFFPLNEL